VTGRNNALDANRCRSRENPLNCGKNGANAQCVRSVSGFWQAEKFLTWNAARMGHLHGFFLKIVQKNRKKGLQFKVKYSTITKLASGMMRKVAGIGRRVISADHGRRTPFCRGNYAPVKKNERGTHG
jgi:hypothetical protein